MDLTSDSTLSQAFSLSEGAVSSDLSASTSSNQLAPILGQTKDQLMDFAASEGATEALSMILNRTEAASLDQLLSDWSIGNFSPLPTFQVLSNHAMQGAQGAFAPSTAAIYLSESSVNQSPHLWLDPLVGVVGIAIEEIGHAVDQLLNPHQDTRGDEGELLKAAVLGDALSQTERLAIQTEDDHGVVLLGGNDIDVEQSVQHGNTRSNSLRGTTTNDRLYGYRGNDRLYGYSGDDRLYGHSGHDRLYGYGGNDRLYGHSGDDRLSGQAGHDRLYGGHHNDRLYGGSGHDSIYGGNGDDLLHGNSGHDYLYGGSGNDCLNAYGFDTSERDQVSGGSGIDTFVLGTTTQTYYAKNRFSDYATINDFSPGTDTIQLQKLSDMVTNHSLAYGYQLTVSDDHTWIFRSSDGEAIACIQRQTGLSLTSSQFSFVGTSPADLAVQHPMVPGSITVGETVSISAYTSNIGGSTANHSYLRYWLSNDTHLDGSDHALGFDDVGNLGAGTSAYNSHSFTYDGSWGTGNKYILFHLDTDGESNRDNNLAYRAITVKPPVAKPTTYQDFDASTVFSLSSQPDANHTIYLDFDGHTTHETLWNAAINQDGTLKYGSVITTPAYDADGDGSSFSTSEREIIWEIWQRVSEDFIPFNVNVTTAEPVAADLIKSDDTDTKWGIRVAIGGNCSDWYDSSAGGLAYVNSFNWSNDTPAFVFQNYPGKTAKSFAEVISHEVGHTLNLHHDGDHSTEPHTEYYGGHGSGPTGWASIMGVGYYQNLTQWSKGDYNGANQQEDDLSIITTMNGFGYRADDYSNQFSGAATLSLNGAKVDTYGVIEQNIDIDWFKFSSSTGTIALTINPFVRGANLDVLVKLYDSAGQWLQTVNPVDDISASLNVFLAAGDYYLSVEGIGKAAVGSDYGYSDYGSLGQYSITGSIS